MKGKVSNGEGIAIFAESLDLDRRKYGNFFISSEYKN